MNGPRGTLAPCVRRASGIDALPHSRAEYGVGPEASGNWLVDDPSGRDGCVSAPDIGSVSMGS